MLEYPSAQSDVAKIIRVYNLPFFSVNVFTDTACAVMPSSEAPAVKAAGAVSTPDIPSPGQLRASESKKETTNHGHSQDFRQTAHTLAGGDCYMKERHDSM